MTALDLLKILLLLPCFLFVAAVLLGVRAVDILSGRSRMSLAQAQQRAAALAGEGALNCGYSDWTTRPANEEQRRRSDEEHAAVCSRAVAAHRARKPFVAVFDVPEDTPLHNGATGAKRMWQVGDARGHVFVVDYHLSGKPWILSRFSQREWKTPKVGKSPKPDGHEYIPLVW